MSTPQVPDGYELPVTSPTLATDSGIVKTRKDFVFGLTMDLTDSQAQQALSIVIPIKNKWTAIFAARLRHGLFAVDDAMELIDQFEDELVTTLTERMGLIATVDAEPVFDGQPPIINFVGCVEGHDSIKYGFDHEREAYEVRKAHDRGEQYLGEKEPINSTAKARDKAQQRRNR